MSEEKQIDRDRNAEIVTASVGNMLETLHVEAGLPLADVLAGAHAQIVVMLASAIGGEAAAEQCQRAGERVRPIPSWRDAKLAATEPAGRA